MALDVADLKRLKIQKRYALIVILSHSQLRHAMDDAVNILIRKLNSFTIERNNSLSSTISNAPRKLKILSASLEMYYMPIVKERRMPNEYQEFPRLFEIIRNAWLRNVTNIWPTQETTTSHSC